MHAQTNHSDGGAAVGACGGSEVPQGGTVDPTGAYTMMRTQAGGDFMLASEHNHMYDGSTGTNTAASPTTPTICLRPARVRPPPAAAPTPVSLPCTAWSGA
ncbi:MAG: hypothetical protein U1F26_03355 [Lysobacterales bacterium]